MKKYLFLLVALVSFLGCNKSIADANALLAEGDFLGARHIYQSNAALHPHDAIAQYGLAMTYCAEALYKGTLGVGVSADWYLPIYYMTLAYTAEPAKPEYSRTLAIFHYNIGSAFKKDGARENAIARYEQAVAYDSTLSKAYNALGSLYQEIGDTQNAQRCYEQVLKLQPEYAPAHFNIGVLAWSAGNFTKAESSFAYALSLSPENSYFAEWARKAAQKVKDHQ